MSAYLIPIQTAFLFFPFLAALITIPYMLYQYHKYGSIPILRTLIVYSFILYLTNIYFLVILPLPSRESVAQMVGPRVQLVPFQFISDFIEQVHFDWTNLNSYKELITAPPFYQVAYNILMLIPFGIYMRYYFKCGFIKTLRLSFLLSLFFELTQLSGLYGIYSRGYRLFDVDDLILNTLGGVIGYLIAPILSFFLPSRDRLDEIAYQKGEKISFLKRFFAFIIDWFFLIILIMMLDASIGRMGMNVVNFRFIIAIFLYFVLLPSIYHGCTLGKRFLNMKIVTTDGEPAKWYQYMIRYFVLYFFLLQIPTICIHLLEVFHLSFYFSILVIVVFLFLVILYIMFWFQVLCLLGKPDRLLIYEKISKTKNQSTIHDKKKREESSKKEEKENPNTEEKDE